MDSELKDPILGWPPVLAFFLFRQLIFRLKADLDAYFKFHPLVKEVGSFLCKRLRLSLVLWKHRVKVNLSPRFVLPPSFSQSSVFLPHLS